MTIQELQDTLPSGFHDALLHRYSVDIVKRYAELGIELCVGVPKAPTEAEREAYRSAVLRLSGLVYFITDAPDPRYEAHTPWRIDLCDPDPTQALPVPDDCFAGRFFSADTNSFIHFAASGAEIAYAPRA